MKQVGWLDEGTVEIEGNYRVIAIIKIETYDQQSIEWASFWTLFH